MRNSGQDNLFIGRNRPGPEFFAYACAVTRVKFLRYDPFQAKFGRAMAVLGKSQSVDTANAKGSTSDLLIDIVSFL